MRRRLKLSLEEEAEWLDYFNEQKAKADDFETQISQTDAEIDRMVYELYGLSKKELSVVDGR